MTAHISMHPSAINAVMSQRIEERVSRIIAFVNACHQAGIVLLSGPMKSGKTETLMRVLAAINARAGVTVLRLKPKLDDRQEGFCTHTGLKEHAFGITTVNELRALIKEHQPSFVFVDEVQFLDPDIASELVFLSSTTVVIASMLDMTFKPTHWASYLRIVDEGSALERGKFLHLKLEGLCQKCGDEHATHSMLTVKPPKEGTILTGASEYLTVCESCHEPPPQET